MNKKDIKLVEEILNIELPSHYIDFIIDSRRIPKDDPYIEIRKNYLIDDPEYLIDLNDTLKFHLDTAIIQNKLCIGENGGGDFFLIDLKDKSDKSVYLFDHEESVEYYNLDTKTWNWDGLREFDSLSKYSSWISELFGEE
ncbi:SMI1/KNR4 family protein [Fulvivirga ligni]|uniref:SMI1/KNR4 family protein n=1 Tax=Fulvivirga ligni TaxID=2904246 RepID=UPI001F2624AF|nr:SMI1/KNR4 family protein [Fulvivirga ligni]UII20541.1 SMI1/KNR4 family protein [Fulvivirga ligni]